MKDTAVGQSAEKSAWTNAVTDPMTPLPFRVISRTNELADTFSLQLEPAAEMDGFTFTPGQFNMLYGFGVGEVPISISGTRHIMPTKSFRVTPGPVKIVICKPIPILGTNRAEQIRLMTEIRKEIEANFDPELWTNSWFAETASDV